MAGGVRNGQRRGVSRTKLCEAVRFHLTVNDLTETFAPYLTMSEGLKLAAQTLDRDVSRLSCCV